MEPFSILGAVGTSVGLLGFILTTISSTIETVNRRRGDFRNCKKDLERYQRSLESHQDAIREWGTIWLGALFEPYDHATYDYLWGAEGHQVIQKIANDRQR